MSERIKCEICGAEAHSIKKHLETDHPETSLEEYRAKYPSAPLLSERAKEAIRERQKNLAAATPAAKPAATTDGKSSAPLHELFGLGNVAGAMNSRCQPIPIQVINHKDEHLIPDVDDTYVYELDNLKNALLAIDQNIPLYIWGHAGTGKTTLAEQISARTKRAVLRVQHTVNTEEVHIIGQRVARNGETPFELGPLALAMKHGWVYLADEYDFALPHVLSVYQPVLEGKPLVIKEADGDDMVIRPHKDFRFIATGNTNGSGDETGLYQGTSVQNAANYDRFNMVLEVRYMKPDQEKLILVNKTHIAPKDADKLVDFANRVRESYDGSKISSPISPRTLIASARIGMFKGSFRAGISLAFANKLSRVDREVVDGLAQRIFG